MSVNDKKIENIFVTYEFHAFDAHENDQYFFKPGNETARNRLDQFFKNNSEFDMKFIYRKHLDLYLKVKHKHINNFFHMEFEKHKKYLADVHLVYYENTDSKGYYPKISLTDYEKTGDE